MMKDTPGGTGGSEGITDSSEHCPGTMSVMGNPTIGGIGKGGLGGKGLPGEKKA